MCTMYQFTYVCMYVYMYEGSHRVGGARGLFCVGLPVGCASPSSLFWVFRDYSFAVAAAMDAGMDTSPQKISVQRMDWQGRFFCTSRLNKVHGVHLCTKAGWYVRAAIVLTCIGDAALSHSFPISTEWRQSGVACARRSRRRSPVRAAWFFLQAVLMEMDTRAKLALQKSKRCWT